MTKTVRVGIFVITLLYFGGCATKQPIKNVFKNCENTFVLSDGRKIVLFEHDEKDVPFRMLKQYEDWSSYGAFLDCQRNIIVSPYAFKGFNHDTGGVTIFTLHNDQSKDYEIRENPVGPALGRYKNGVLLGTVLLQKERIKEGTGYIPPAQIFMDEGIPSRMYTYTLLFDLDQRKVVKSYSTDPWGVLINGDVMWAQQRGALTKIDLNTGYVKKLFEWISLKEIERGDGEKNPMGFSLRTFTASGDFYLVPVPRRDHQTQALTGYEKGAIYKLENEKFVKQVSLPDKMASLYVGPSDTNLAPEDPFYMLAIDEHIYVFTRQSKQVFRFHTKTKELKAYDLKLPIPDDWHINSIGYTKENFIVPVSQEGYKTGGVFVVKRDFSKVSDMYKVPMGSINTTTQENITTDSVE